MSITIRVSLRAAEGVCEAISVLHLGDCFVGDPSLRSGRLLAMTLGEAVNDEHIEPNPIRICKNRQ